MRALDRKLLRDLWQMKGQAIAIGLVIASGVAMFVAYLSTFQSLRRTLDAYYDRYRMADVFMSLTRAPARLEPRIAAIPGVARVQTRVVADVTLDVAGMSEPATGRLISIPERRQPIQNDVFLRAGRYIEPDRPDEVLVAEGFAKAHHLEPGDDVQAIINGRKRRLYIVGIALSPEYIYSIRPSDIFPDDRRFGLFWMGRKSLAAAYRMEGAWNDVTLELSPGASENEVMGRLDRLLRPYGGLGAIPRSRQVSHWYLDAELVGLETAGLVVPMVFLAVAAFLLNAVLARIVAVQREQIAALKALGYAQSDVAWHYTKTALVIAAGGTLLGTLGGAWMGHGMTGLYRDFFRFPILEYRLSAAVIAGAALVSFVAAAIGAAGAVRRAARLPPAEAMRPEAPALYRPTLAERLGLRRLLSPPALMVLRNLERNPGRSLSSLVGIAFAVAMLIVGLFGIDALDVLIDVQFNIAQRQDMMVTFANPAAGGALHALRRLPGVLDVEPLRAVAVKLHHGHRSRHVAIMGIVAEPHLNRVIDASYRPVTLPPRGLVLSRKLAELLGVGAGDVLSVEVLEGRRPTLSIPVVATVEEFIGTSAYMEIGALRAALQEGPVLSGAFLATDPRAADRLHRTLKAMPAIAGVTLTRAALQGFQETLAESLGIMIFFNVFFAGIIAAGVVYNAARISLSERSRELASLRVLGFTRAEISSILLGELALLTIAAQPAGIVLGRILSALIVKAYDTELYRFPLVISSRTYAFSVLTVIVAAAVSGLVVRRKLDRLDLVAVLKTRE